MKPSTTDKDGLLKLEDQVCFALYSTSRAITKHYAKLLDELGITYPQYLALLVLWKQDGLQIQEIARNLELEGATTTPLIQRMEKLDLVIRQRSTEDERQVIVFLTEKGKNMYKKAVNFPHDLGCAMEIDLDTAIRLLEDLKHIKTSVIKNT